MSGRAIGSEDIDASRRIMRNSPLSGITTSGLRVERLIETSSNTFWETLPMRFASGTIAVSRLQKWAEARSPSSTVGSHEDLRSAPKVIRTLHKKWSKHDRVHAFERTMRTTPVTLPELDTGGDHVHSDARVAAELPAGTPKLDLANEEPVTTPRETQKEDEGLVDLLWHLQNGRGAGR